MSGLFYSLGLDKLSVAEQRELLEELRDMEAARRLSEDPGSMPDWMVTLTDERLAELEANPGMGITRDEARRSFGLS